MSNLLAAMETYLVSAGATPILQDDTLASELTVAVMTYGCNFWADDDHFGFIAEWCDGIPMDRFDEAQDVLMRLVKSGDGAGQTLLNKRTGQVMRRVTVDLSMVTVTPEKIGMMVETLLQSFGEKLKLMKRVLDGAVTADDALKMVEELTYEASEQRTEMYIMVKKGIVQLSEQPCGMVLPIFVDHAEAKAWADRHGATVAEVGSLEGETLENHLNLAAQAGARGLVVQGGIGGCFIDRK